MTADPVNLGEKKKESYVSGLGTHESPLRVAAWTPGD